MCACIKSNENTTGELTTSRIIPIHLHEDQNLLFKCIFLGLPWFFVIIFQKIRENLTNENFHDYSKYGMVW